MGFDNARIVLDSPTNTYYAGQIVNGRLIFSREKVKNFRGIYVDMKGYCKVHWTSQERNMNSQNDHDRYRTINHDSYEVYLDHRSYIVGGKAGDHSLPAGHHELPFSIRIPESCPSAVEGEYGHVRYELKVVVDRAFKVDQELTAPIKIMAPLDLNMEPKARDPIQMQKEETYCCWCVSAGSSETTVKLPYTGYCVGQAIPVEIGCINRSNEEITIKLVINKELTFRAQSVHGRKTSSCLVVQEKCGVVPPHVTRHHTVQLLLPEAEFHNLDNCDFIDVDYELKVTVSPDGCHDDTDDSCYLIFGTIPLGATQPMQAPQVVAPAQAYPQPITQQPYPGFNGAPYQPNQPYPGPYPGAIPTNSPYPAPNPAYPAATPYSPNPYPPGPPIGLQNPPNPMPPPPNQTSPYPSNPYPPSPQTMAVQTSSNPTPYAPSPYPQGTGTVPYPITPPEATNTADRTSPYPKDPYPQSPLVPGLKTGTLGFVHGGSHNGVSMPPLPTGALPLPRPVTPSSPYAASAPEPGTPDDGPKPPMPTESNDESQPAFNPAFANQKTN